MRALVVFESMFGNTRDIAEAVGEGLRIGCDVDVTEVGSAPTTIPYEVDLIVIGGPTHAFGMTRESTREDAARRTSDAIISSRSGLREWLEGLAVESGTRAAAFDTKIARPRVPGSAAKGAAKRLRRVGAHMIVPAETFYVIDVMGPLVDGELERARGWGESLAEQAARGARAVSTSRAP